MLSWILHTVFMALLGLMLLLASCGETRKEKEEKEESERKEQQQIKQKAEQQRIEDLEKKYNAVYFPPNEIRASALTYSIQKYFEKYTNQPIVFKGYLEDLEALGNSVVVEFYVPFGDSLRSNEGIRFRLTVPEEKVKILLLAKRPDPYFRSLRFISKEDYVVVAKVENLQKIPTYRIDGTIEGESVDIKGEAFRRLISVGQLLEATATQKE